MNDNTKVLEQNPTVNQASVGNQVPVQPTGNILKEQAPIGQNLSEFVRRTGPEVTHAISKESAELGVKETSDRPDLMQVSDIRHAGPSVPVPSGPSGSVKLPMSEEEVKAQLETGQDDDSGKWLSKLIQKIMKVMGV